jgi:hypothetical protein
MVFISILVSITGIYLVAGFLFAIAFVTKGVGRIDEGAHGASWGFRVIIIPGTMVFWPLLLNKWIRSYQHRKP